MKNVFNYFFIAWLLAGIWTDTVMGQTTTAPTLPNNIPPSPTAAALGQYGDVEVGHYTGVPNISVPLYTLSQNGFDLNLSLSYQTVGLRYMDEASNVGLGWSLNASGVITRSIKDGDDFFPGKGYYQIAPSSNNSGNPYVDKEPDIFYYNFNGHVGKFIIVYNATQGYEIKMLKKEEELRIELTADNNFRVTDDKGIIYEFFRKEITNVTSIHNNNRDHTSAWFLSRIVLRNGEQISFTYNTGSSRMVLETVNLVVKQARNVSGTDPGGCSNSLYLPTTTGGTVTSRTEDVRLTKITAKNCTVDFGYASRVDLAMESGSGNRVSTITVRDGSNTEIRKFTLSHGYFVAIGSNQAKTNRLKLNSVSETGQGVTGKQYVFYYNEGALPSKTQPFGKPFGFYEHVPTVTALSKIRYPTGGLTEFYYEPHDYSAKPTHNLVQDVPRNALGIRIKRIVNKGLDNEVLLDRNYEYTKQDENGNSISSGKMLTASTYLFTSSEFISIPCLNPATGGYVNTSFNVLYDNFYNNSIVPLGGSLTTVGYDRIAVIDKSPTGGDIKEEFLYHNEPDFHHVLVPGYPGVHDPNNGSLKENIKYRSVGGSYQPVEQSKYVYTQLQPSEHDAYVRQGISFWTYTVKTLSRRITQVERTSQEGTLQAKTIEDYTYTANHLLPETVTKTLSNGKVLKTIKRYPYHFTTGVYPEMVGKHMLDYVVEDEFQVANQFQYKTVNAYGKPNANRILPTAISTMNKGQTAAENRVQLSRYDDYDNLVEAQLPGGVREVVIWGYKGQYPVAKVINTTYAAATGLVDMAKLTNAADYSDAQIRTELDKLRAGLPGAQVSTYTYRPLLGMTSETDPSGQGQFYHYDGLGRLDHIKDDNGHILESFCYAYSGQQVNCGQDFFYSQEQGGTFTRNNCGAGQAGTSITYVVPAGDQTSAISQADANAKAQVKVQANGQAYANANAGCEITDRYSHPVSYRGTGNPCSGTSQTATSIWMRNSDYAQLGNIPQDMSVSSGLYAYANVTGPEPAAPGWYADLYSGSGDGNRIRLYEVAYDGEILSYMLCNPPVTSPPTGGNTISLFLGDYAGPESGGQTVKQLSLSSSRSYSVAVTVTGYAAVIDPNMNMEVDGGTYFSILLPAGQQSASQILSDMYVSGGYVTELRNLSCSPTNPDGQTVQLIGN